MEFTTYFLFYLTFTLSLHHARNARVEQSAPLAYKPASNSVSAFSNRSLASSFNSFRVGIEHFAVNFDYAEANNNY